MNRSVTLGIIVGIGVLVYAAEKQRQTQRKQERREQRLVRQRYQEWNDQSSSPVTHSSDEVEALLFGES